ALGMTLADLFADRPKDQTPTATKINLADLARDKGLPVDFLKALGLHDIPHGGVGVPYKDATGHVVETKRRTALRAKEGSFWAKGKPLMPYGLERLAKARERGKLLLVEGESDSWTAWHHGLPCLGIPGASNAGCLKAAHLEGITRLLVWQEPDQGGKAFVAGLAKRLKALGWRGEARVIQPPEGFKDLNDLHRLHSSDATAFRAALKELAEAAQPLPEPQTEAVAKPEAETLPIYRCLADVKAQPIHWLWKGRIARGKVSVLAGHPGLGKSQATASMAAITTTGGLWPVDATPCERGSVVFLSAEDDPADTIRPRLEAAGADLKKCHVLEAARAGVDAKGEVVSRPFSLETDRGQLEAVLERIGDVALVVIDPITAYLGTTDSHRNAEVRALLAPLSALAARHEVAVLCVSHLNKGAGDALMRVIGSVGFVAAARAGYLVAKDAQRPERRLFLPIKNNIGADQTGLAFTIEGHNLPGGIETSRVLWEGQPVTTTADEALAAAAEGGEERSAVTEAKEFLETLLTDGPVSAKQVERVAGEAGIAERTLKRAKKALGVVVAKAGYQGAWEWEMPSKGAKDSKECQEKDVAPFGDVGPLWAKSDPGNGEAPAEAEKPEEQPEQEVFIL
ncbi:MAG: AAA family ATPase, partial [Pseudomonadota bacterium]